MGMDNEISTNESHSPACTCDACFVPSAVIRLYSGNELEYRTHAEALDGARKMFAGAREARDADEVVLFIEADEDGEYVVAKVVAL